MARSTKTGLRHDELRAALVEAAERTIATDGLHGLRARPLADAVGCSVGAIYNVVEDLDELVLLVNKRTLAALESQLATVSKTPPRDDGPEGAIARLSQLALRYLDFAAANISRWRALFDHRLPAGRLVPDWYRIEQKQLFDHVEGPLRELQGRNSIRRHDRLARTLFSAVHGIAVLGLEEKLETIPLPALRQQMTLVVTALGRGLIASK